MSDVVRAYLELGLRLGRHLDGLVDSYYGPPEVKERTDSEEPVEPKELAEEAARLLESLDDLEENRRTWLRAQLVGLETAARKLAGEEISYEDEVERYFGIRPRRVPESEFEAAHRKLDDALPGTGPLAERYLLWREEDTIPPASVPEVIARLVEEASRRARELVGLPVGESIDLDYVTDEPWAAFNYYLGGLRSRVAINTDIAMVPDVVFDLSVHETYPGHHTEHAWKEQLLVRERGQLEESLIVIPTPQSIVSEGIASYASQLAFPDDRYEVTASTVSGTGVRYDAEVSRAVMEARTVLDRVGNNAALMLHRDGASVDEAREYVQQWALRSEQRAAHAVEFITDPMWRSYGTTYTDGYDLCKGFVDGDLARFKRLLTEQLTPADLR